jgi:uncharacterized membrane protein
MNSHILLSADSEGRGGGRCPAVAFAVVAVVAVAFIVDEDVDAVIADII